MRSINDVIEEKIEQDIVELDSVDDFDIRSQDSRRSRRSRPKSMRSINDVIEEKIEQEVERRVREEVANLRENIEQELQYNKQKSILKEKIEQEVERRVREEVANLREK